MYWPACSEVGMAKERPGYIKSWRKELDSDIWQMPPIYHRVWHYLQKAVSWEENIFPTCNGYGIHLNPGQNLFSIQSIVDGVAWKERNVEKKPNKKTVLHVLKWLTINGMIDRESNAHGTFISICNWKKYNSTECEKVTQGTPEGTPQGTPEGTPQGTPEGTPTKEVLRSIKKLNTNRGVKKFQKPTIEEVTAYCQERNNNISSQAFIDYYEANGWMVGKNKMKCWRSAVRIWEGRSSKSTPSKKTFAQLKDERTKQAFREFSEEA